MNLRNLTDIIHHAPILGRNEDEQLHLLLLYLADAAGIIVPEESLVQETDYILEERRYQVRYGRLMGLYDLNPQAEDSEDLLSEISCRREAEENLKKKMVLDSIIEEADWTITREELEKEAEAIAERQGTSLDFILNFLGPDLLPLKTDILYQKAESLVLGIYHEALTT